MKKTNTRKEKTEILKRRFKEKKKNEPEVINPFGDFKSKYAHLIAWKYLDSDQFAMYEAYFPKMAQEFYTKSGADKFNHDALDIDIEKHTVDEHKHIDEQLESHLSVLEDLHIGVEIEKTSVIAKTTQISKVLEALYAEHDELQTRYNSFNRKVG